MDTDHTGGKSRGANDASASQRPASDPPCSSVYLSPAGLRTNTGPRRGNGVLIRGFNSARGTVTLVALCLVLVIWGVLATYLALTTRAMQLSNRSFQSELSHQLAEAGIEEGLRAFNRNDWSDWSNSGTSVDWTLDTTNKRATATIIYPANKFAQGTTATVKVRVDNYDAYSLDAPWISSKNYRPNELVGYNGTWYVCIRAHSNQSPLNMNYWVPESIPWQWNAAKTYVADDLVVDVDNGTWYRCTSGNSGRQPSAYPAYWQSLVAIHTTAPAWPYVATGQEALLINGGAFTRLTNQNSTWGYNYTWRWRSGPTYNFDDVVYYNGVWYRCLTRHTNNGNWTYSVQNSGAGYWEPVESISAWNSATSYSIGDVVYHSASARWYRCVIAHSNQAPSTSSAYWSDSPLLSSEWNANTQYSSNDTVIYGGVWYLSLQNNNRNNNPATDTSRWIGANTTNASYRWNATSAYVVGAYRSYGGAWYRCIVANTGRTPNNTAYWTSVLDQSSGVKTGTPVVYAEATVNIGDGTTNRTQLRAPISPASLFPNAVAANNNLTISSSGGTVDSYDSLQGTYTSQVGSADTNYSAMLVAGGSSTPALSINNTTTVRGYVAASPATSSPFAPQASFSSGTTIKGPSSPVSPNVDLSRVSRSPFITNPSIQSTPSGVSLPVPTSWPSSTLSIGTAGAVTPSVYEYSGSFDLSGDTLHINGPVILNINGELRTRGTNGKIQVNSSGSVRIHFNGRLRTANTTGSGLNNTTSDPKKMIILGTSSLTTHQHLSATYPFYGILHMPNGTLSINNSPHHYGAISANSVSFGNAANVHYDTSLRYTAIPGVDSAYTVSDLRELPAGEQATMP